MKFRVLVYLMFITALALQGQIALEQNRTDFIKSVQFKGQEYAGQFPLVKLNETFTLSFDDLLALDNDYYYRIKHFNRDWTPSELFTNQYLTGYDNLRIDNYQSSFNTLQRYTHYTLSLPNERTQFNVTGNYMIEVYNADDELVFSRKFLVYDEKVQVQAGIYPARDLTNFASHQNIQFSVTPLNFSVRNPQEDLTVLLLQNDQWDTAFFLRHPNSTQGTAMCIAMITKHNSKEEMNFFTLTQKTFELQHQTLAMSIVKKSINITFILTYQERVNPTPIFPMSMEIFPSELYRAPTQI